MKKIRNKKTLELLLEKPEMRICEICGAEYETDKPLARFCKTCCDKEGGMFVARWWNQRHTIVIDEVQAMAAMSRMHGEHSTRLKRSC